MSIADPKNCDHSYTLIRDLQCLQCAVNLLQNKLLTIRLLLAKPLQLRLPESKTIALYLTPEEADVLQETLKEI